MIVTLPVAFMVIFILIIILSITCAKKKKLTEPDYHTADCEVMPEEELKQASV